MPLARLSALCRRVARLSHDEHASEENVVAVVNVHAWPLEFFSRGYQKYTQTLQLFFLNSAKRLSGTFRIWQALGGARTLSPPLGGAWPGRFVADSHSNTMSKR